MLLALAMKLLGSYVRYSFLVFVHSLVGFYVLFLINNCMGDYALSKIARLHALLFMQQCGLTF